MELLGDTNRIPYFDPYEIVIDWGLPSIRPEPSLDFDPLDPEVFSKCLHEFTHLDGMNSEMGLSYLYFFWKTISIVNSNRTANHNLLLYELHERFWLLSILLEGQAMFAQLNFRPSKRIEASTKQYSFMLCLASSYGLFKRTGLQGLQDGISSLFLSALEHIHASGVKKNLLSSQKNTTYHYFLGYLFFKNIQAYLSQYDRNFEDPEIFFIFINNFLFNNIFSMYRVNYISPFSSSIAVLDIVHRVKLIAKQAQTLLKPILHFPDHEFNFEHIDYWKTFEKTKFTTRSNLNDIASIYAEDLLIIDEYFANLFYQSVIGLNFCHLKSVDAHILGFLKYKPFLMLSCGFPGQKYMCALRINDTAKKQIEKLVKKEECNILYEDMDLLDDDMCLDGFLQCEVHVISRMAKDAPFTCIATEKDFILLEKSNDFEGLWDDNQSILEEKGYTQEFINTVTDQYSNSSEDLLWHLRNSEFVRSRKCRARIISHFKPFVEVKEIQEKARDNVFSAFEKVLFPTQSLRRKKATDDNPLIQKLSENNMLPQLYDYCQVSPMNFEKSIIYNDHFINFNKTVCEFFSGNVFFNKGANGLRVCDFL